MLFLALSAGFLACLPAMARQANDASAAISSHASRYHPVSISNHALEYYRSVWGADRMQVRRTASGNLIRFSYRVTDPARARALGDDHSTPYLFGQRSHAVLQIPVMENVGKLRQTERADAPMAGKEYWMVFSNKGDLVKAGDRVNVIIGSFHVDGLIVE